MKKKRKLKVNDLGFGSIEESYIPHLPRILAGSGYTAVASHGMGKPWEPQEPCWACRGKGPAAGSLETPVSNLCALQAAIQLEPMDVNGKREIVGLHISAAVNCQGILKLLRSTRANLCMK